jgi:hypothetical protein
MRRNYKLRPWHRWECVTRSQSEPIALGGFTFRWAGLLTNRICPPVFRRYWRIERVER